MMYLLGFGLAFALCAGLTPLIRRFALAHGIVDHPSEERKIHRVPVAYLGGAAIFAAFAITALLLEPMSRQFAALLLGCGVLVVVGVIDDIRGLSPWVKLVWQFVAAGIALAGGIGITEITNPFGGVIKLDEWGRTEVIVGDFQFHITPIANALSLLWMVGLANTINFLDGLDGLAAGVSGIAAVVMFALSVGPHVDQPATALLAIILAGAAFGFLPQNFFPAKIFMGDSGAYFLGLVLAMLAVYSGAKLATALLVLGVPIVDSLWVVTRRLMHRTSPFQADRRHFHHLLLDAGLSQRQAVLTLYAIVAAFGGLALIMSSFSKLLAMAGLAVFMVVSLVILPRRRFRSVPK
jgi:UDP-GlcNAc:undecaprenyl-phosphate/decaprenyl-phosphate GlcNAc-1-phosphate transferase